MKKSDQNQALHLLNLASDTIRELLPLCVDRLNTDEKSLALTERDVERIARRLADFVTDHKD